jgi:mono/diheme cytochrome c family protein
MRFACYLNTLRSLPATAAWMACLATMPFAVHAQDFAKAVPEAAQLKDPAWIAAGRAKFVPTCAYCHGQEGDSGKNRPFRERIDWDAEVIFDVISNGRKRGANVMPAWGDSISEEERWKIVAYIKSLGGQPRQQR